MARLADEIDKWASVHRVHDQEFIDRVDENRRRRMSEIDRLSPPLRQLVHSYGWTVVNAFLQIGVMQPRHIRHLVETVLNEFSPTRGSSSSQGIARAPGIDNQ